jgi:hypothetical protein
MAMIDPTRHPLLHEVAQGAQRVGTDEFPSCVEWADEHEARTPGMEYLAWRVGR